MDFFVILISKHLSVGVDYQTLSIKRNLLEYNEMFELGFYIDWRRKFFRVMMPSVAKLKWEL